MSNPTGADTIHFTCPRCTAAMSAPALQSGTRVACSQCQTGVLVPDASTSSEAPAPVVSTEVHTSSATAAGSTPAVVESNVPLTQQDQTHSTVVQGVSVGAQEVSDPTAGGLRAAATPPQSGASAPAAQSSYSSMFSDPDDEWRRKGGRNRNAVVAVSVLLVLAIGSVAGVGVYRGTVRARWQGEVEDLLLRARTAYKESDTSRAAQIGAEARKHIAASPVPLEQEKIDAWQAETERLDQMHKEVTVLEEALAGAEKDIPGMRSRLENKKILLEQQGTDTRPVVLKIENFLSDLRKLEERKKLEKLRAEQKKADELHGKGEISKAADEAAKISAELTKAPKVEDRELESRLRVLVSRAEQLKKMQSLWQEATGSKQFAEAKKVLQNELKKLDAGNPDLQPLVQKLTALKTTLLAEEKKSRMPTAAEANELKTLGNLLHAFDARVQPKAIDGEAMPLEFAGKTLRMGFHREGQAVHSSLYLEVDGNRFLVNSEALRGRQPRPLRVLTLAVALGEAMKKAGLSSEDIWNAADEAPFPMAHRLAGDGNQHLFLKDRLYIGRPAAAKPAALQEAQDRFKKAAETLEEAVRNDSGSGNELRRIVAKAVHATHKEPEPEDWYDHLRKEFVRNVVAGGYIERNLPAAAERIGKQLQDYYAAYAKLTEPTVFFTGSSEDGNLATQMRTAEDHALWAIYDKTADSTTFAIKNPDDEKACLFVLYQFPGKLSAFPADGKPTAVHMSYEPVGVVASYDLAADKMSYDKDKWDLTASLEAPPMGASYIAQKGFGRPAWGFPPHVLLVDTAGHAKAIVTPTGRLELKDFKGLDGKKRTAEVQAYFEQIAKVLPSAGYLHLYFRFFVEYSLDSPVTSQPELLGSREGCGDIHQTAEESLLRVMGGRMVGDCDDLAEFFMEVTRKQNKLSYVMALPSHAACGWTEKAPGSDEYTFYILDTGPPRMFQDKNLDRAIERACRAYDETKTMRFDPKSLGFLFRFNGEATRAPYWLSSRMYIDKEYGEIMERVQGYWHFHFYALGVKQMTEMIEKGDRVPENCTELAGLYGQVREVEDAVKWTNEALKQLGPEDKQTRFNEIFRIALQWRGEREHKKAYEAIKETLPELKKLETADNKRFLYTSTRLQTMGLLESIDRPWEAWDVVAGDIILFARAGQLKIEHAAGLANIYGKMQEQLKAGKTLRGREREAMDNLKQILTWFYDKPLFSDPDDDFNAHMRKYALLGDWYGAKDGQAKLVEELLKPGPFPDLAQPRDHRARGNDEDEDWKWIRLSPMSYTLAIADALDPDDSPEKWRKEEAVKLCEAMVRASEEARKFGSLASSEFQILSTRVFRDFLVKDWADLEKVLQEAQKTNWARLTSDIAETFGRSARFVTPDEFAAQYRVFLKYIKARTAPFTVVYEAYRTEGIPHAIAASKIALEAWPGDEDMAREAKYLEQLAQKKLAKQAAGKPKP